MSLCLAWNMNQINNWLIVEKQLLKRKLFSALIKISHEHFLHKIQIVDN